MVKQKTRKREDGKGGRMEDEKDGRIVDRLNRGLLGLRRFRGLKSLGCYSLSGRGKMPRLLAVVGIVSHGIYYRSRISIAFVIHSLDLFSRLLAIRSVDGSLFIHLIPTYGLLVRLIATYKPLCAIHTHAVPLEQNI